MSKEREVKLRQLSYLNDFKCAADKCPDTCCSQWVINITSDNKKFYDDQDHEVLEEVESHSDGNFRMKRSLNGDCVQLENGFCKLQKKYGETNLPDVCYTFPRTYKKVEKNTYMTANLACPESLRVALYNNKKDDFSVWSDVVQTRDKSPLYDVRDNNISNLSEDDSINIFNSITKMIDDNDLSSDEAMAKLLLISKKMDGEFNYAEISREISKITKDQILKISDNNLDYVDMRSEFFRVLEAMFVLINRDRPRYNVVVKMVKNILGDNKDDEDFVIDNYEKIYNSWEKNKDKFESIFKNLIKVQLSYSLFPVGGNFLNKYDDAAVTLLEYLVVKIAFMCKSYELGGDMSQEDVIDIIQPTAKRFYVRRKQELLDFCNKAGWNDFKKAITLVVNI